MSVYPIIEEYSFGNINIGGEKHTSDVIIYPGRITGWWRERGHFLQKQDLTEVIDTEPDVLVVGTGYHGRMSVSREVEELCRQKNITLHIHPTGEAVDRYNRLIDQEKKTIVAALHLTC